MSQHNVRKVRNELFFVLGGIKQNERVTESSNSLPLFLQTLSRCQLLSSGLIGFSRCQLLSSGLIWFESIQFLTMILMIIRKSSNV